MEFKKHFRPTESKVGFGRKSKPTNIRKKIMKQAINARNKTKEQVIVNTFQHVRCPGTPVERNKQITNNLKCYSNYLINVNSASLIVVCTSNFSFNWKGITWILVLKTVANQVCMRTFDIPSARSHVLSPSPKGLGKNDSLTFNSREWPRQNFSSLYYADK